jgi:hypothetical protein
VTGLVGISVGTAGISMVQGPGISDEPQGWGVEGRADLGWLTVGSVDIPTAAAAVAQPGDITAIQTP